LWKMENIHEKLIILILLIVTGTASANLVGHWKFDEGIGNVAYDSSAYGNNGIFKGDPQWVVGYFDGALEFDGTCNWLDCGTNPSLDITGAVSITSWIKVGNRDIDHKIAGNQDDINGGYKMGIYINNRLEFEIRTADNLDILNRNVAGGTIIKEGVWYHVAGVYSLEDGYIRTYVNGVLDREMSTTQVLGASSGSFKIGCEPFTPGAFNFNGAIDDLRLYNHALDEAEIKQLYNSYGSKSSVTPAFLKLTEELHKARSIAEKQGTQEVIVFLEKKIAEYGLWKEKNTNNIDVRHELFSSECYFMLAKAKEAVNAPTMDIATAYKHSISQQILSRNYVPALLWLFSNIPEREYIDAIKTSLHNCRDMPNDLTRIAKDFESSGNWAAFELFCDTVFSEADDKTSYVIAIASDLRKNDLWAENFLRYAQSKSQLTQYVIAIYEKHAQEEIAKNKFPRAAEIYREIVNQCSPAQDKTTYELKVCECIFESGEYNRALSELDNFINNNKSVNEDLVTKAMLLKGQVYLQLSKIDRAYDIFTKLKREYPKTKRATGAGFYIGYCNMLQSKYKEAAEALNRVVRDCPQDPYANKARLCLAKIKRVTE
jgi:outer membrane protein assembly factor BamD (BamD/ComL family)